MRTPGEIRNDALDCLRQADRAQARRHKAILLILAQGWASLAEEMERRGMEPAGEDIEVETADKAAGAKRTKAEMRPTN